jgi:hypothetical protein
MILLRFVPRPLSAWWQKNAAAPFGAAAKDEKRAHHHSMSNQHWPSWHLRANTVLLHEETTLTFPTDCSILGSGLSDSHRHHASGHQFRPVSAFRLNAIIQEVQRKL